VLADHSPSVGDVVIVKDDQPRGQWKMATIDQLRSSHDGLIRAAVVRLPSGTLIKRPLNLLYPLESSDNQTVNQNRLRDIEEKQSERPKRKAAIAARDRIKVFTYAT